MEGWLNKRGGIIKIWKKRYCVLQKDVMKIYPSPGADEEDIITLTPKTIVADAPECKKQFSFKIEIPQGRTYYLQGESQIDTEKWISALKNTSEQNTAEDSAAYITDFEFLSVLGRGTFGKVSLVRHKKTKYLYAIKAMSKRLLAENDQISQIITERNVLIKNKHPFLVSAYYTFQNDTKLFVVLDYIPGGELFRRLKEEGLFSESRSRLYAAEIALALGHLHKLGIIYRDLKPENILVDTDGHIRITDFGLVKPDMTDGGTTETFCGTPEYLAPEMLLREPYTKAVDWWAFGIFLFEMLCGTPPFYHDNAMTMYQSILNDRIEFPSYFSDEVCDLIEKLLARNPADRLGSSEMDVEDIKAHPFFSSLNWDDVYHKRTEPEWVPIIQKATDTSMFEEEFTGETAGISFEDPSLIPDDVQAQFQDFTLTKTSIINDDY